MGQSGGTGCRNPGRAIGDTAKGVHLTGSYSELKTTGNTLDFQAFPAQHAHARDERGRASSPQDCSHVPSAGGERAGPHITYFGATFAVGQAHASMQSLPAITPHCQKSSPGMARSLRDQHCPIPRSPLQGSCTTLLNRERQEVKLLWREVAWTKVDWSNQSPRGTPQQPCWGWAKSKIHFP